MKRGQHGHYDHEKQLPDNRMQPTGSGYDVWLNARVTELLGEEAGQQLIAESVPHNTERYQWLCEQLALRGYPEVSQEYAQKKKDAAAASRLRDKQRHLNGWRERLAEASDEATRKYLKRQIEKAEKYILERSEGPQ